MKLSLNWLKDYVSVGTSSDELAHKLTMAGLEVEKTVSFNGDTVFELEITPNRPDCLSILGLARETAAILNKPRKFPKNKRRAWPKTKCAITIEDRQGCSRYIGTVIKNVSIKRAQEKIVKRLGALGMRPINNVVDITNFSLMENGQPLHAFDYDKLAGKKIVVRRARKGEKITTIDDVERTLDPSILVIADEKRAIAIAGIMGGKDTEVTMRTKNILLESACFDSVLIRRAARKLALSSDSSYRFERGVDIAGVENGASRAIDLILDQTGGRVTQRSDVGVGQTTSRSKAISISKDQIGHLIGSSLSRTQCVNILKKLDCTVTSLKSGMLKVTPPSFRTDIKEAVDIVEEISRIIGYDNLPLSFPQIKASQIRVDSNRIVRRQVKDFMVAQGFNEIITYTMISYKDLENAGQSDVPAVQIFNPLSQDQEIMRPTMLPNFLSVLGANINRGQKNVKIFEVGKVYSKKGETDTIGILMSGIQRDDWRELNKKEADYYDLKGAAEQLFQRNNIEDKEMSFHESSESIFVPGQGAGINVRNKLVGHIGKIEETILRRWGIKQNNVYFAQISIQCLYECFHKRRKYVPVPEFPSISRDISLAVKTELTSGTIDQTIRKAAREGGDVVLTDVKFIELYMGDKIPKDQRGLIYSLTYRSRLAKTLRDEEVDEVHNRVCAKLVNDLGVVRR